MSGNEQQIFPSETETNNACAVTVVTICPLSIGKYLDIYNSPSGIRHR